MPTSLGKYALRAVLGRGGMGVVYEAWDPSLNRSLAVKLLEHVGEIPPEAITRFRREAQIVAALNHPNIVTIYELGEENGAPFIAMELVRGSSLSELIGRRIVWTLAEKTRVIADLCLALQCAHDAGIIHRDVKPANIMISVNGQVKLLDFGVAHLAGSSLTHTHDLLGTPAYIPPEVVQGGPIDARSDVYSLCATLYEWMTLRPPFEARQLDALLWKILHERPTPMRRACPDCPASFSAVVEQGLAKDPAARPQAAADLRRALLDSLREPQVETMALPVGGPVVGTESPSGPLPRTRRDWRLTITWSGLAVLLAAFTAGVVAWLETPARPPVKAPHVSSVSRSLPLPTTQRAASQPRQSPRVPSAAPEVNIQGADLAPAVPSDVPAPSGVSMPRSEAEDASQAFVVVPVGTPLSVRILSELRTDRSRAGERFIGQLQAPVVVAGEEVLAAGSRIEGLVDAIGVIGNSDQRTFLELSLIEVTRDHQAVPIQTARYRVEGPEGPPGGGVRPLVIGAAVGAVAGGVVAGGEGAILGGGAGALVAAAGRSTRTTEYVLGDRLTFRLAKALVLKPQS